MVWFSGRLRRGRSHQTEEPLRYSTDLIAHAHTLHMYNPPTPVHRAAYCIFGGELPASFPRYTPPPYSFCTRSLQFPPCRKRTLGGRGEQGVEGGGCVGAARRGRGDVGRQRHVLRRRPGVFSLSPPPYHARCCHYIHVQKEFQRSHGLFAVSLFLVLLPLGGG